MSALTGAQLSFLSMAKYGYDFVVGATQLGINNAMVDYLGTLQEPVVSVCWTADSIGNPVNTPCSQVMETAGGVNPFNFGNTTVTESNPGLLELIGARFVAGFQARLGLPAGANPSSLPDIVILGDDTASVTFNMLCSEFVVVQLGGGLFSPPELLSVVQDPSDPWIFTSSVDMRLDPVDQSAFDTLPPAVQAQIKNLGSEAFSVQQLLFDLDNAGLAKTAPIPNVVPGTTAYTLLETNFVGAYFSVAQAAGQPVLAAAIVAQDPDPATLPMTNLNFEVSPYVDTNGIPIASPTPLEQSLATLNYLCATDGDALPEAVRFGWNWVGQSQTGAGQTPPDGAMAINRNALASYFETQLTSRATQCSILPHVTVTSNGFVNTYSWEVTPGQTPTISPGANTTGATVLSYSYAASSSDQAGLDGILGKISLSSNFDLDVNFTGTSIIISQHMKFALSVSNGAISSGSGNIVDKTIIDTYLLSIDQGGSLNTTLTSQTIDDSYAPTVNGALNFFSDLNDITEDIQGNIGPFVSTFLDDIPISVVQNFVFPGGKTFNFLNVGFSENQDLVSAIKYLPSS